MAKPRVFVSSTYYDLKYVRERIENFISAYCMDPILFESDDVFFNPNTTLDESCYNEIKHCHMMILIVGGRYGSYASEQKEQYEKQFISITQREYETACQKNIPVMVFVEQNVYSEYKTYLANKNNEPTKLNYAFVDDVRVFQFISKLDQNAIKVFAKVDDIEHFFAHQISGMLLEYLLYLQENKTKEDIKNAVNQLNRASSSMQTMLNTIAEKVLEEDKAKYQELLRKQNESLIDFFIELFDQNMNISKNGENIEDEKLKEYTDKICEIIHNTIFNEALITPIFNNSDIMERFKSARELQQQCATQIKAEYENVDFSIELYRLLQPLMQIVEITKNNNNLEIYFNNKLHTIIRVNLSFPF